MTSLENNEPGPASIETLLGGLTLTVCFEDGHKETVHVRQVPLKEYRALMDAQTDEFKWLEIVCEKPEAWAEAMRPGDYNRIFAEAERINADFFVWCRRQIERVQRLAPGFMEKALAANVGMPSNQSASQNSAP
ncbi:MAG: hypothetical protein DMF63_08330, partial [Acidobacteria bacterium]